MPIDSLQTGSNFPSEADGPVIGEMQHTYVAKWAQLVPGCTYRGSPECQTGPLSCQKYICVQQASSRMEMRNDSPRLQ